MCRRHYVSLIVFLSLAAIVGCGGGNARLVNDLKVVGLAYHRHNQWFKRGPENWDDLAEQCKDLDPASIQRVRDAGYQVKWRVNLEAQTEDLSKEVLAERADGGPKLMMDGSVRQ